MAMNKLVTLPLALLLILSFIGVVMATSNFTTGINSPISTEGNNSYLGVYTWDLTSATSLLVVIGAIIIVVILFGASILGTQLLSDTSQVIALKAAAYFGMYGAVSVGSSWAFNSIPTWGNIAYVMLTIMFALGYVMDIRTGSA